MWVILFQNLKKKIDLSVFVLINNFDKYSRIFIYYLIDWTFFFLLSLLYKSFAKIVKRKQKKRRMVFLKFQQKRLQKHSISIITSLFIPFLLHLINFISLFANVSVFVQKTNKQTIRHEQSLCSGSVSARTESLFLGCLGPILNTSFTSVKCL